MNIYKYIKRLTDFLLSIISLVILSPIILIILVIVYLEDKENPLYLGERVGKNGRMFFIIKIRSMRKGSEHYSGTTQLNDSRITPIGKFIRYLKLDELLNLINIIKGDMSFIGPRPEMKQYASLYSEEEKKSLSVRPGLTDYASLRFISLDKAVGETNAESVYLQKIFKSKNSLRVKYAKEISLYVDMKIFILTILAVLKKAFFLDH